MPYFSYALKITLTRALRKRVERLGKAGHYVARCIICSLLPYFVHAYIQLMHFKLIRLPHTLSLEDFQIIIILNNYTNHRTKKTPAS